MLLSVNQKSKLGQLGEMKGLLLVCPVPKSYVGRQKSRG